MWGKQAASVKLTIVIKGYIYRFLKLPMTLNASDQIHQPNKDQWPGTKNSKQPIDLSGLPILASTRKAMRQQLRKTSLSFESLAALAERDPAVCLHMLTDIGKRNPASLEQISSASGCISLLGMQEVVKLVKALPVVDEYAKDSRYRHYVGSLHSAALAGTLAAKWSANKPGITEHQAQWSAMLASAPFWLWHINQVEALQTCLHKVSSGQELSAAISDSFGEDSNNHWRLLARSLHLPKACQSLWQKGNWPKPKEWALLRRHPLSQIDGHRELKHQCQHPEMLIFIANMVALHGRFGWLTSKSRRWISVASNFLNHKPREVYVEGRDACLSMANQHSMNSAVNALVSNKARCLIMPPAIHCIQRLPKAELMEMERDEPTNNTAESAPTQSPTKPQTKPSPATTDQPAMSSENQENLKRLMKQMSQTPESFGDWHYLMRSVLKGITENIGLKRSYIAIMSRNGSAVKVYYQEGLDELDPLCHCSISLQKPNIMKKLLEKPAGIMITEQNREKMLRGIAPAQQQVLPAEFMMMSLFANDRPLGIIFADTGTSGDSLPIQPSQYMTFKTLALTTSKSLGALASNTKRPQAKSNQNQQKRA